MTSLPMLAGSIVHDEVERTLKILRYGRKADIEKSKENVIKNFKQSWAQSKNKEWKPENSNFLKRKRKRNALVFALYINVFLIFLTFNSFIAHLLDIIVEFQKFSYPV